ARRALFLRTHRGIVRHENVADGGLTASAREGDEAAVIDVAVAEGDEPLVLAAIVPLEEPVWEEGTQRVGQALKATDRRQGGLCLITASDLILAFDRCREERRGRQLMAVSGHDDLLGAVERGDSFFLEDLARLVEDNDVEVAPAAVQQLADRERARD